MKLDDWKRQRGITLTAIADLLDKGRFTVSRWIAGTTKPQNEGDYRAIYMVTNGKVTPNDFFAIHAWKTELKNSVTKSPASDK